MRCDAARSVSIRPPAGGPLALAATLVLALPLASRAAPELALQRDPVTLRVALDAQQLKDARVHVPSGTHAYRIGDPKSPRGALLAWYRSSDGRLLAAVQMSPRDTHPATQDGVQVHAGAGHQGRAPALFEVATVRDLPGLADAAAFAIQPQGGAEQALAPLLSYRGSTHVVALAPAMDQAQLRAASFDVRTRDANGAVQTELRALNAAGGTPPVLVSGAATRPGVQSELSATNPGQTARLLEVQPQAPLRWSAPSQGLPTLLPPGAKTPIGTVVSEQPGAFNLIYRDQPVQDPASGQLGVAPLVSDRAGASVAQLAAPVPIQSVQIAPPAAQGAGQPAAIATVSNPAANGVAGSSSLNRIAIAGAAAGVMGVWLTDRDGRRQASEVAIVPLEEDLLQRQREWVTIETVESSGEKWMQDGQPCECEKLTVKPKIGPDKNPVVTVKGAPTAGDDTAMTLTISADWVATLLCTPGDGNCSDKLILDKHSSRWRVDNNTGTPVPGTESFSDSASPPTKPSTAITCSGPCGAETSIAISTTYTIQIANGRLRRDAPKGASGKIGKGVSSGTVSLSLMPDKCGGSGWTMVLSLVGKGTDLHVDWVNSDRDGDGWPDGVDKIDDPTAKPKPKPEPKPDPKAKAVK